MLEIDEYVTKIVQHMKIGKIFYSSHKSDFKDVQIREIRFESGRAPRETYTALGSLVTYIGGGLSTLVCKTIGINQNQKFKKLQAMNSVENSQYTATTVVKQMIPNFLDIFEEQK